MDSTSVSRQGVVVILSERCFVGRRGRYAGLLLLPLLLLIVMIVFLSMAPFNYA